MNLKPNISCKKASFLINKEQETSLSLWNKIQLKVHLATCSVCSAFKKQTDFIVKYLTKNKTNITSNVSLDNNKKEEIKKELENLMQDDNPMHR